ncbi:MAG: gamma-glutamyl-gamma-aminobutyrate hydrolase family protein [Oscillospiraceae bacterium]|nr:gamma-glutamyl-gamma-aminobutyrate hydrolase family protein [Oscillospiraceae bacterium]
MKPEIQISLGPELVQNYPAAVEAFGGIPAAAYLPEPEPEKYDALILSGGGDVDPARYGEENNACFGIDAARDEAEFRLIEAYLRAGKPILGICRGHQVLNVFFGGSLTQHLPGAEKHVPSKSGDNAHETRALPVSFPAILYGESFRVNSAHHQGINRLAPELEAVQWAEDGIIEACRHKSLPVYSVQWHPERMCLRHARADTVDGGALFRWFIGLAEKQTTSAAR